MALNNSLVNLALTNGENSNIKDENLNFPKNFDFSKVGSLSNEVVEKLNHIKPQTIGAASRISGITPPAIIALLRHVRGKTKKSKVA